MVLKKKFAKTSKSFYNSTKKFNLEKYNTHFVKKDKKLLKQLNYFKDNDNRFAKKKSENFKFKKLSNIIFKMPKLFKAKKFRKTFKLLLKKPFVFFKFWRMRCNRQLKKFTKQSKKVYKNFSIVKRKNKWQFGKPKHTLYDFKPHEAKKLSKLTFRIFNKIQFGKKKTNFVKTQRLVYNIYFLQKKHTLDSAKFIFGNAVKLKQKWKIFHQQRKMLFFILKKSHFFFKIKNIKKREIVTKKIKPIEHRSRATKKLLTQFFKQNVKVTKSVLLFKKKRGSYQSFFKALWTKLFLKKLETIAILVFLFWTKQLF